MLNSNETVDQLARINSVRWHGHVLKREDDYASGFWEITGFKTEVSVCLLSLPTTSFVTFLYFNVPLKFLYLFQKFSINFTCRKCEGNIGEAVEH